MKSVNNFAVTGFVGQDAKINKFNNASVARFGLWAISSRRNTRRTVRPIR